MRKQEDGQPVGVWGAENLSIDNGVDVQTAGVYEITYYFSDSWNGTGHVRLVVVVEE